jgi:hypothetical protein
MMPIGKEQALALATETLRKTGRDPDRYDVTTSDHDADWEIAFVGKSPRRPGDEVYVYVSKSDGQVRTMQGE